MKDFQKLYKQLVLSSPHLSTHNHLCTNCDYSDQLNECKNAYLCFNGYGLEDCMYTFDSRWNRDCTDLSYTNKCELCFECIDTEDCYNCNYMQDCENCTDCSRCIDCFGCTNCFGCVGLRKAQNRIFNTPVAKTEQLALEEITARLAALHLKTPIVAMRIRRSENCFGNYIFDSKNAYYAFKCHELEDCMYMYNCRDMRDSVDIGMMHKSELIYDSIEATENYNCNFIYWCANCSDCEYIMYCFNCEHCFGCFNLKHKRYHILNKPYKPAEYTARVKEIKATLRAENSYINFLPDIVL